MIYTLLKSNQATAARVLRNISEERIISKLSIWEYREKLNIMNKIYMAIRSKNQLMKEAMVSENREDLPH